MRNRRGDAFGRLDEFNPRTISNDVLVDVTDARMRDAAFDDDGTITESETEIVERIELQREAGLHLHAAMTHLADRSWLEDHYLTVQRSKELDALGIPLVRGHSLGIIA